MNMDLKGRVLDPEDRMVLLRAVNNLTVRIEFLRGGRRYESSGKLVASVRRRLRVTLAAYRALDALHDIDVDDALDLQLAREKASQP